MISAYIEQPFQKVIIVGAGPSGLLLALLLSQHNIPSVVLEEQDRLDERLHATQYGVPASRVFRKAGIIDDVRAASIEKFPSISWRRTSDHERLTGIDLSVVQDEPDRMTVLPLNSILQILYKHCTERGQGLVDIRFNHRVVDLEQNEESAWVDVEVADLPGDRTTRIEGDYIVGCDGASSTVRQLLFGRNWPGETFDCRLIEQNIYYDGFERHGWDGANYLVDRDVWGLVAKRDEGGLWRATYGDIAGLTEEQYVRRRAGILEKLLPGNPKPHEYRVEQATSHATHNRCVPSMRDRRVLLAGDAAHVCNPFGDVGSVAAVLDVAGLAECFVGVWEHVADERLLDTWAQVRRDTFLDHVDTRSRKNMARLVRSGSVDELVECDPFLTILKDLEGDEQGTREFLMKQSSIEYDFTRHYKLPESLTALAARLSRI